MESKFKRGEKVFSILSGAGTVIEVRESGVYPVRVSYPTIEGLLDYAPDGKSANADIYPEIFKDGDIHPLLNVPVRIPKQKVTKELNIGVNVYRKTAGDWITADGYTVGIFATVEKAKEHALDNAIATVPATIVFEVEE